MSWREAWSRAQALRHESAETDAVLMHTAMALSVPIIWLYGFAGVAYGQLPMLTPAGFVDMPGVCAWLTAVMAFAVGILFIDWLVRGDVAPPPVPTSIVVRHWQSGWPRFPALPPEPSPGFLQGSASPFRSVCLIVAAVACVSALVFSGLDTLGWSVVARPGGLAPRAEWPLYPLPWIWPWLLPLARQPFALGTVAVGAVLLVAAIFMRWRRMRGAWFPFFTALPILVAPHFLGAAGFDYAAARGLGGLNEPALASALAQHPGRYNVYTFLSLWGGIGAGTVGLVLGFWFGRSRVMDED